MDSTIGNCSKHPGHNMVNCPICATEQEINTPETSFNDRDIVSYAGDVMRIKRKSSRISQDAMASALNLTRTSIVNIESGRQALTIGNLYLVASILNTNISLFFPPLMTATIEEYTEERTVIKKTKKSRVVLKAKKNNQ